jgi:hypothetical protein
MESYGGCVSSYWGLDDMESGKQKKVEVRRGSLGRFRNSHSIFDELVKLFKTKDIYSLWDARLLGQDLAGAHIGSRHKS